MSISKSVSLILGKSLYRLKLSSLAALGVIFSNLDIEILQLSIEIVLIFFIFLDSHLILSLRLFSLSCIYSSKDRLTDNLLFSFELIHSFFDNK